MDNIGEVDDVEVVNFHTGDIHHLHNLYSSSSDRNKSRRNIWTDKKNAALVEIVRNSPYPTPWRPAHGTNKEIWMDICRQMHARPDIFDFPIQWEAAKEQLLKIIDRQKMRRSLGDFEAKNATEKYVDEMIKHMLAEDAERQSKSARVRELAENRELRKNGAEVAAMPRKRRRNSLKHLPTETLIQLSSGSFKARYLRTNGTPGENEDDREEFAFQQEREKLIAAADASKEKIRTEREKERDELLIQRDQMFLKFVQDQLASNHSLKQTTQALVAKVAEKWGI